VKKIGRKANKNKHIHKRRALAKVQGQMRIGRQKRFRRNRAPAKRGMQRMSKVKCPVCPHESESYETLFRHLMLHKKGDIVNAFLRHLENVEAKLSKLESDIAEISQRIKMLEELKEE
jgi:hypothetical protein